MHPHARGPGQAVAALRQREVVAAPEHAQQRRLDRAGDARRRTPPPIRLASRRPSSRAAAAQRYTVERPTANRRAAVSGLSPASTAANTRLRRSVEYAPAMGTSAHSCGQRCPNLPAVCSRAFPVRTGSRHMLRAIDPASIFTRSGEAT